MHKNELIALEWINNNPNPKMTELNNFCSGNKDLKTMIRCLLMGEDYSSFERDQNKNDLSNYDKLEAILEYAPFEKWFLVFCKNDLFTIDYLYKNNYSSLAKKLLEMHLDEENYIDNLTNQFVFKKEYLFSFIYLIKPDNIDEFLFNIDPFARDLHNIKLEESDDKEKMLFFQLSEYISPRVQSINDLRTDIMEKIESLKYISYFKQSSNDEIFQEIIPNNIPLSGTYIFEKNSIAYLLKRNIFDFIHERIDLSVSRMHKQKNEHYKQIVNNLFNGASLASFFFLPQEAVKVATFTLLSKIVQNGFNIIDNLDKIKDGIELGRNIFSDFLNINDIHGLYKEFQKSEFNHFQDFFKYQLKLEIDYFLYQLFNQHIVLSESIYEDVYNQFFTKQILPLYEELKNSEDNALLFNEQISTCINEIEKEDYMISCVFNAETNPVNLI